MCPQSGRRRRSLRGRAITNSRRVRTKQLDDHQFVGGPVARVPCVDRGLEQARITALSDEPAREPLSVASHECHFRRRIGLQRWLLTRVCHHEAGSRIAKDERVPASHQGKRWIERDYPELRPSMTFHRRHAGYMSRGNLWKVPLRLRRTAAIPRRPASAQEIRPLPHRRGASVIGIARGVTPLGATLARVTTGPVRLQSLSGPG